MHTIVTSTKKNCLTYWQVVTVSCSVKVDGVTRILAKSQAARREATVRVEKKSEGELLPRVRS